MQETEDPPVRLVRAPNPSPMTERGTNTWILGRGEVAVIDPGPALPGHLDAILAALAPGERVTHVLVTHPHLDHSPLARDLAQRTGARVHGFGTATEGRSAVMERLAASGAAGGGEGLDHAFAPDRRLADGDAIEVGSLQVEAIHTPGHLGAHLAFSCGEVLFSGDHVMGWASTMISPPDGDLGAFMASCRRLQPLGHRVYFPGHGDPVTDPQARLDWLIGHRLTREAQILESLATGPATVAALTARIYRDTPPALHGAASRNVLAHLIDLTERDQVQADPELSGTAVFALR